MCPLLLLLLLPLVAVPQLAVGVDVDVDVDVGDLEGVRGIGEGVCVVWHGVERCQSCRSRTTTGCLSVFGVQLTAKGRQLQRFKTLY